jgi:hypothetical protein
VLDALDDADKGSIYRTLFKPGPNWAARQPLNAKGEQPGGGASSTAASGDLPPSHLSETCPTLRDLYMAGELEWSEGEPAVNVYTASGEFGPHKDHLAVTVLLPLTAPAAADDDVVGNNNNNNNRGQDIDMDIDSALASLQSSSSSSPSSAVVFSGGGTGFWAGNRDVGENPGGREPT